VWLQGDNPSKSLDSRNYGPVPLSLVSRRAMYRLSFPLAHDLMPWTRSGKDEHEHTVSEFDRLAAMVSAVIPKATAVDNSKILDEQQQYIVKD